jgi:hypothetical protein
MAASLGVSCNRVQKGTGVQGGLERGSRGLGIVRSRYQTTSEDTAGWKRLSVILYSVEIAIAY